ncbi:MAG: DNA polymerase III subunit gamma/tau [Opitutae bacterium]|jgi:DNA polymerase-3 subunit delta'|nr:DNA polymerase III subunit gamma/tau [Opitutae bacterium]|tara:strand:+ start:3479 stop:4411 length:933 start_codon:yes stop_codon:yes gene_type:complete
MPVSSEDSRAERVLGTLETAIAEERLPHGVLLHGNHLGHLEKSCLRLTRQLLGIEEAKRQHPDLHELRPQGAARVIKVDQARALIEILNHAPSHGSRKVAVIHDADSMNLAAANAFLKTLEEPPRGTTIFLLTTKPYALLQTIRSRCQRFRIDSDEERARLPAWAEWIGIYRAWLTSLVDPKKVRSDPSGIVLAAFGLIYRFESLLSQWTAEAWDEILQGLPEEIDEKEKKAAKSGCRKGIRRQLFIDLETETHAFAVDCGNSGPLPATAIFQAIETLEIVTGLMDAQLKETTALEHFLLSSLRIWTTPR